MRTFSPTRLRTGLLLVLTLVLAIAVGAPAVEAAPLQARVAKAVRASGLAGQSSVVVYRASDQLILYQHRPGQRVTPASNQKLYTAAAALKGLGPQHRFQTTVALEGTQTGRTFTGTIFLIGGGDPTLSTRPFAQRNMAGNGANLDLLTNPLRLRGIKTVQGSLVVDDSWLDGQRYVRSWPSRFRYDETTALGGLTVNQSYLGRGLFGKAARQPALHAGDVYLQLLKSHGITVTGGVAQGVATESAVRVGTVESPPLETIVGFMNRRSDNFTAEILLKDLGRVRRGAGSTAQGAVAARQVLSEAGLQVDGLTIADGSGLSSANRTTARNVSELLNLLDHDADAAVRDAWLGSMAVAGTSGTLWHRMRSTPVRGRVRGKTGTLRQTSALSGYATRATTGERYGFAVITYAGNGRVSYTRATRLQDAVASILVR